MENSPVFEVEGRYETIVVYDNYVEIITFKRRERIVKASILYKNITNIKFHRAGMVLGGYIQFDAPGLNSIGAFSAYADNSWAFVHKHNKKAAEIRDYIQKRILEIQSK